MSLLERTMVVVKRPILRNTKIFKTDTKTSQICSCTASLCQKYSREIYSDEQTKPFYSPSCKICLSGWDLEPCKWWTMTTQRGGVYMRSGAAKTPRFSAKATTSTPREARRRWPNTLMMADLLMGAGRIGTGGPLVMYSLLEPTSLDPEPKWARLVSTLRPSQSPPGLALWSQLSLRVRVPFLRKSALTNVSRFDVSLEIRNPRPCSMYTNQLAETEPDL